MSTENIHRFRGRIQQGDGGGAFVAIPFDVERVFGSKRVKIKACIDGIAYRGSLVRMGSACHLLLILKEIRERLGKQAGDEVDIALEEDLEPRRAEPPEDMLALLEQHPDAERFFQQLAYSYQREYVRWIEDAKRAATRQQRLLKMLDMLQQGKKLS